MRWADHLVRMDVSKLAKRAEVEDPTGYFREGISSLPVPDTNFQEAKLDYLGQLIVTPEIVAKKIKPTKGKK